MTHFKSTVATLIVLSAFSASAFANSNEAADSGLPKEVAQMQCLIGEWSGKLDIKMGKQKMPLDVTISCEATSKGFGILCKSRFEGLPSGEAHEETDLFGYDPQQNQYHWFAVSNEGETHDHVAEVSKTPTVNWVYKGKMESKPFTESVSMTFNKAGTRIRFKSKATVGNATLFTMCGSIRKRKQ